MGWSEMSEYKAIVKMKISEVQFHASDNLTQEELESEVFKTMLDTASARLGKKESECSAEELLSELYEIQIKEIQDCLNCSASCSDDDENGNMILRCSEHDWKIVDESDCCDEWR